MPLLRSKPPLTEELADGSRRSPDPHAIGDTLRQRRAALGLDLDEVAAALKIKPGFLAALEEGRPGELPGRTYAIGFLRAYGTYLGLDSGEVVRRFKRETEGLEARPNLSFPVPLRAGSVPGGRTVLAGLILALCGYGAWYAMSARHRAVPQRASEVPFALLRPPPHPVPAVTKHPIIAAAPKPPAAATPPASSAKRGAAGALASAPKSAVLTEQQKGVPGTAAHAAPPPQPAAIGSGSTSPPPQIVIRATAASWIEVRNAGNAIVYSRVLQPGESYDVPDQPGLTLRTGNAGGLAITVDGKPTAKLGALGAIRRRIVLRPQALLKGATFRR
ncbi:MAG: helix-turn-helix domain-containing protein [Stellaceae bacterium]